MTRKKDLKILLSEEEYAKLKAEAQRRGVSMADVLREPIRFMEKPSDL